MRAGWGAWHGRIMSKTHREIAVKVNAFVDEGVAPLVAALNDVPNVLTLDSCEGGDRSPYVYLTRTDGPLPELVEGLAAALRASGLWDFSAAVEWQGNNDRPRACLSMSREHVGGAAEAIRAWARGGCQTNVSVDDK